MGCLNSKATAEKKSSKPTGTRGKGSPTTAAERGSKTKDNGKNTKKQTNEPAASVEALPTDARACAAPQATASPEVMAGQFLRSVLEGAEHCFNCLPDSKAVKQVVALTFMNSCVEVTRTKFRLKMDVVTQLVSDLTQQLKLPLLFSTVEHVEERSMDDGFSRILLAWYSNNSTFQKTIPADVGQQVLDTLYIRYASSKAVSFEDILVFQLRWVSVNGATLELFTKLCEGKDSMSPEQLGKFLRETQRTETTDRQTIDKYKYRFGNGVHRYNFASYNGGVLTNNAIDPARTSDVWQDMTQSFTHYLVSCARIETKDDLQRAMADGTRTLVLNIKKSNGGELFSGSCPLREILENVQKNGFATDNYPIVLCLSPKTPMPIEVQDSVAKMITDILGSMLAKGLMFEGALISDPNFSPGAMRKRVLVMSNQSRLKPFIGFLVADMNKDGLGVRVTDVVEGTPAVKGGIAKDDWLTHINGHSILNKQHLRQHLSNIKVGEEFTMKRENLDELTIVMGGIVDAEDRSGSVDLSNLTFFKYSDGPDFKPWDTQNVDSATLRTSTLSRKDLVDHFAYTSMNASSGKDAVDNEGIASRMGIQFVDVDNSEGSLAWARGRFADNGRCGYLLKTEVDGEKQPDFSLSIIGGPRVMGCAPLSSATVVLHGRGTVRHNGNQFLFTGSDDASIAVIKMTFDVNGTERSFTASFGPSLIRTGYRALPCVPVNEERASRKHVHGVYIFSSRN